jgi:hypothetical protein
LKKIQAEAGDAPERDGEGKLVKDAAGKLILKNTGTALRWVGNGRTIYNNKSSQSNTLLIPTIFLQK